MFHNQGLEEEKILPYFTIRDWPKRRLHPPPKKRVVIVLLWRFSKNQAFFCTQGCYTKPNKLHGFASTHMSRTFFLEMAPCQRSYFRYTCLHVCMVVVINIHNFLQCHTFPIFSCPDFRLRQLYTYPCHSLTH